jgi:hypothetical protein
MLNLKQIISRIDNDIWEVFSIAHARRNLTFKHVICGSKERAYESNLLYYGGAVMDARYANEIEVQHKLKAFGDITNPFELEILWQLASKEDYWARSAHDAFIKKYADIYGYMPNTMLETVSNEHRFYQDNVTNRSNLWYKFCDRVFWYNIQIMLCREMIQDNLNNYIMALSDYKQTRILQSQGYDDLTDLSLQRYHKYIHKCPEISEIETKSFIYPY